MASLWLELIYENIELGNNHAIINLELKVLACV